MVMGELLASSTFLSEDVKIVQNLLDYFINIPVIWIATLYAPQNN